MALAAVLVTEMVAVAVSWLAVAVGAGMAVVVVVAVVVSRETVVAASNCVVGTGIVFGVSNSSSIFGEARSHFTRKCRTRVDQEVTAAGEFFLRFSYQSSAS
jgi:acyl CoA:acetate/3-ketoacid CoA transferase